MIDWTLVGACVVVLTVYLGAGLYAQAPSGRTKSTSA